MRIVADADIPHVAESFGRLGVVHTAPAAALTAEAVREADVILVRSVTTVDEALLTDSGVRIVGTATSGVDHIDRGYLRRRGIALANAAGCNANAVAEYVAAALLHLQAQGLLDLAASRIGIVGLGHVGRKTARYARVLGMECVVHDPPLERSTAEPLFQPLDAVLACDVITLHVPLERGGLDPTYHLVDEDFLAAMRPGAVLINTSRGAVVDEGALAAALRADRLAACVLDVWEHEPRVDPARIHACAIATPHIAGHSLDAKLEATRRLFEAVRALTGADATWFPPTCLETTRPEPLTVPGVGHAVLARATAQATRLLDVDRRMRELAAVCEAERARAFAKLRSQAPARREFPAWRIRMRDSDAPTRDALEGLGFQVSGVSVDLAREGAR